MAILASAVATASVHASDSPSFDAGRYAAALKAHVNAAGLVDYAGLKADRADLDAAVRQFGMVPPAVFDSWSDKQKAAFLINAYNALTLRAIVDNYPIEPGFFASFVYPRNSIRQIDGVWDEMKWDLAGRTVTLGQIEHEMLRKRFNEPRIHMAVNCASVGCPPLRVEPYTADRLDEQLDDQTRRFLADPTKFRIDRARHLVYLSPIFDWFGDDFTATHPPADGYHGSPAERSVLHFIAAHLTREDADFLRTGNYRVTYQDYDWSLNEQ